MQNETPVTILLDGLYGWHHRWKGLCRRVERTIGPAHIWKYPNHGRTGLDVLAERLAAHLRELDLPFHLVGYSMGGLVAREAMRQFPDLPLRRAAFLHVPHYGSFMAHCLPFAGIRQMRPGSEFLRALDAAPWPYPTFATWCPADLMILPGHSARWKKASHIHRSDIPAHAWPVYSPAIHRLIVQFLRE